MIAVILLPLLLRTSGYCGCYIALAFSTGLLLHGVALVRTQYPLCTEWE
jgi:hypothetical protein